jgi:hypothetical protein
LRPDDHRNHPELRHVSSLHYRLRHQSCRCATSPFSHGVSEHTDIQAKLKAKRGHFQSDAKKIGPFRLDMRKVPGTYHKKQSEAKRLIFGFEVKYPSPTPKKTLLNQSMLWIWIRIKSKGRIRIRIKGIGWIRIRINLQMTSQNVWNMSIFEHFSRF